MDGRTLTLVTQPRSSFSRCWCVFSACCSSQRGPCTSYGNYMFPWTRRSCVSFPFDVCSCQHSDARASHSSCACISRHLCRGWLVSHRFLRNDRSIRLVAVSSGQGVPSRDAVTKPGARQIRADDGREEDGTAQSGSCSRRESDGGGAMRHMYTYQATGINLHNRHFDPHHMVFTCINLTLYDPCAWMDFLTKDPAKAKGMRSPSGRKAEVRGSKNTCLCSCPTAPGAVGVVIAGDRGTQHEDPVASNRLAPSPARIYNIPKRESR